ncbi:unnamed protein product [Phyllotreta striolata]|uniref:BAH domain-containing protein n=1 Tax=Phyllotreta striolata TaxID=444603 RepID=A0A9N9TQS4_PHYSR|nr:unnamed protein product [Phyllotreta striolata]
MVLTGQEATPKIEFPGLPGIFHTMLGSPSGSGVSTPRGLWPLGTVQAPTITTFSNDGFNKYGVYSLFPGGPTFGSTLYSHSSTSSTTGRFASGQYQHPTDNIFHTSYKVSDSLFSTTSYTFGAPTPPPGSPYSPVPLGQLELFTKGLNTGIIQPIEGGILQTTKKLQEKYCEKCCNFKTQICNCQASVEHKVTDPIQCCTRTTPIKWNEINLKKEPLSHQISEISTNSASMIKLEVMSPTQPSDIMGNNILSLTEPSRSENTMTVNSTTMTSNQADSAMIQCIDKTTGIGARHLEETSYLGSPALWQYSAPVAPVPVEPIVPVPVPPLVVRDPNTGGLLLVSTSGLDSLQQAVVWPGYQQHSSVILPSLPPVPSPSFQLLPSNASHCFSGTSFHQQTQAHSTRLVAVTTDNKRKIPLQIPSTTLIKIETDQPKSLQTINTTPSSTATVITDMTPLITTHVIYQHPTNIIVSQSTPSEPAGTQTVCKSQATSPVACLTPPPEIQVKEVKLSTVQDASNQTELISNEENSMVVSDIPEKPVSPINVPEACAIEKPVVEEKVEQPQDSQETQTVEDLSKPKLALTAGLELLSNSIDQFESSQNRLENVPDKEEPKNGTLEGLNLLCALAEQRILEEKENPPVETDALGKHKKEKRKSKKHSYDEPKRKKLKSDKHYEKKKRKKMKLHKSKKECPCQGNYDSIKIPEKDQGVIVSDNKSFMVVNKDSVKECLTENKHEQEEKEERVSHSTPIKKIELKKSEPKKFNYLKKHFRSKSADFDRSIIASLNNNFLPLIKPAILTETPKVDFNYNTNKNDPDVAVEKLPSTQKRKVGRPKKLMPFSSEQVVTETIVAKKPKSNFIGYFFAAKEKFRLQSKDNPRENINRYSEESTSIKRKKTTDKDTFLSNLKSSKIKPKLKAEPTFKSLDDRDSAEEPDENEQDNRYSNAEPEKRKMILDKYELEPKPSPVKHKCVLTEEQLEVDNLRVLTAMGGLFYAGQLNAVEPPDVYSIILDGERGKRPHIMSREEILRDAIVEVSPKNVGELLVGTRICAYWSQQYRCLYPGSIAEPNSPDSEVDDKFVLVEFDDGDSGRIDLKDIRLLPSDYPVIEYDLNPLQSLMKRKKKPSKPKESSECIEDVHMPEPEPQPEPELEPEQPTEINIPAEKMETDNSNESDQPKHFKKKLLKRIKREKMIKEEKRKKKKHKCYDKKGKDHKHHKKHRKHKKHHNKSRIGNGVAANHATITDDAPVTQKTDTSDEKVLLTGNADLAKENVKDESINTSIVEIPDDLVIASNDVPSKKKTSLRDRQESCESRSKMSAFLPARQLWGWAGKEYKRQRVRGRYKKFFYRSIQRGKEIITIGDAAVFLSTGRPDRPYIGKIEAMWELCGTMIVKVKWFYHPEETVGCPQNLQYPGALFESPHLDENDVQTISHKCDVVPYDEYRRRLGDNPDNYATIYDNNDIYYLAGYYDPTTCIMKMEPGIPFTKTN